MPSRTPSPLKLRAPLTLSALLLCAPLPAQTHPPVHGPARVRSAVAPITLPALFLSDIHFDPFLDPTKAAALNSAPAVEWPHILAAPSPKTLNAAQQTAFAACYDNLDTSYALWQSTLAELKKTVGPASQQPARFVVLPGDLLAHKFDCKYKALIPGATKASYLAFTLKTAAYILATLHASVPGVPIYAALGNNDSACADYALDSDHDAFLTGLAPLIADAANLNAATRTVAEHDFAAIGAYNVPLAALPHTRILSFDDLYLSAKYMTCAGPGDPTPAAAALDWLKTQLNAARAAHDRVWFVGHIPPGVDLYATARKLTNVCGGQKATLFLGSDALAQTLAAYSDVVRLAVFGHTHDDELRLLTPTDLTSLKKKDESSVPELPGVPVKIVGSISPVHGNRPTFTLARVNPAAATLADYTVMMSSDSTAAPITWSREYTYSTTYHQPAFDPASLTALITGFDSDPKAKSPESQAYIRGYYPAASDAATANAAVISAAWQPYACSLNHISAKSFAACTCDK